MSLSRNSAVDERDSGKIEVFASGWFFHLTLLHLPQEMPMHYNQRETQEENALEYGLWLTDTHESFVLSEIRKWEVDVFYDRGIWSFFETLQLENMQGNKIAT